jgi:hypothetical protein
MHQVRAASRVGSGIQRRVMALLALLALGVAAGCSSAPTSSGSSGPAPDGSPYALDVAAQREAYTTDASSPLIHDTETNALVPQGNRLFAATDQWEYPGPDAYGQVLVKDEANGPWKVFEQTQGLRVQALDSFSVPSDQGLGPGHSLLVTQAVLNGQSVVQWALDGAQAFAPANAYVLSSPSDDVRALGAHEANGQWAVYAGVNPTGILRGVWSPSSQTLVFDPAPELSVPASRPGVPAQKVTGFADCGGALYTTINTTLFRRNDGNLPAGVARWVPLYSEPRAPAAFNSGLRGITCITHDGSPSLLLSTEGDGDVYRFDNLPNGQIDVAPTLRPGPGVTALVPTLEFAPIPAVAQMLAATGTTVPTKGSGSIGYVIAAYNNGDFQTVELDGKPRQVFGFEWGYVGSCPSTRSCGPVAFKAIHFDAHACFAIRTPSGSSQAYQVHCLSGPGFTPYGTVGNPIRAGQAFVSIRTIVPSPFGDGRLYYGGYDCNFNPADGTAWVGTSTLSAIHIGNIGKETSSSA